MCSFPSALPSQCSGNDSKDPLNAAAFEESRYYCSSLRFDDDSNIDYDDDMENVVLQERVIELMTEGFMEMNVFMESNCGSVERRCVPFFQCFQFLKRIFSAC